MVSLSNHDRRTIPAGKPRLMGGELNFILRNQLSACLKSDMLKSDVPFVHLSRKKEEVEP